MAKEGMESLGFKPPKRIWPLLVIAAALVVYFHSMLTLSRIPYISDVKSYYYPAWTYLSHAFRAGGPSLWCPGIYCGFPLFADSEMGLFYPLNLLLFPLPPAAGFNYSLIVHYLLGGWFAYAYCRRLRLSRPASLFVSIPFVLGGFFLAHMVHPNVVATAAWMPLFLYCLERALAEGRLSFHVAAGGLLGLQSLSGFMMIPLMEIILAFFYALFYPRRTGEGRGRAALRSLGGLALAVALGAGLGMIQNLPTYNLVQNSYRAGGLSEQVANIGNLPPAQLIGLVFPRAFGRGLAQGSFLGAWTFEETYAYVGILPLLFAPAALLRPRRWHAVFFLWVAAASLLLSLGNQGLLWPALRLLPGFNVLKGPSRFILTLNLSTLILGGMGFDRWREGESASRLRAGLTRFWATVAAAAAGVVALLALLYRFNPLGFRDFLAGVSRPFLADIKHPPREVLDALYGYFTSARPEFLIPLLLLGLFFLLIRNGGPARAPSRLRVALAVFIALADVLLFSSFILKPVPRAKADFRPGVVDFLEEAAAGARVALVKEPGVDRGEFPLCSNQLLPYGLEDAFGFSTLPPARLDRFLGLLNHTPSTPAFELLGARLLYSRLARVGGTPYDLGAPYTIPSGLSATRYTCPSDTAGREVRLLLDGEVLDPEASGRLHIKLNSISRGQIRRHPVLMLEKEAGGRNYLLEVIDGERPASFEAVGFRSPGYGQGRSALELRIPLDRLGEADEVILTILCDRGLEGTRLMASSLIDEDGRGVPLAPWPLLYSDSNYAVYEIAHALPRVFAAWEATWTQSWEEAVDLAWQEGASPGGVILVQGEIDATTRERIKGLARPEKETCVEMAEGGGSHMILRTAGSADVVLVLSVDYLPGWSARVDGEETPLFSAYGFFSAIYLPAGEHTVELTYRPPGLAAAIPISAAALGAIAVLFLICRRKESVAAAKGLPEPPLPPPDPGGISAFFPCYNDSATLGDLIERALAVLSELTDDYEVIVVDDGSADISGQVIDALAARHARVRVVRHDRNRGYGAALRSGIKTSTKAWVFYTDSDGQYDVDDLRRLHALSGAADVINGYKEGRSDPWYRVLLGSTYNLLIRSVFAIPIRDVDCDFRLMRGDLVRGLDLRSEGGAICVEMVKGLQAAGATFAETPVHHYPRRAGKSQFFKLKNVVVMGGELAALWWRLVRRGDL